jgi:TonB-linked SusC/RagA family outer membrane protein
MFLNALYVPYKVGLTKTLQIMRSSFNARSHYTNQKKIVLVMKLTAVILLSVSLTASAKGISQNVTLTVKDATLEKVFNEIRKQTGYDFVYKINVLEHARKVNVSVLNASLQQVLDLCLKDQPLTYKIYQSFIAVRSKNDPTNAQENLPPPPINVKGRVVNENGEPLEGVTVTVKGTKNASATDLNGLFELKGVDENAILVFTGVNIDGYEVKVAGKTSLVVNVKTKITTGEAVTVEVNTGYQIIPKERVTGSFSQIDNKLLNQQVSTGVFERLESIANGLSVGRKNNATPNQIMIRGLSTINGPKEPLIILDNFPYQGDINNINPNDVENIAILKDAAAASIWGARAGNGVIVITTKKGKLSQRIQVELNTSFKITDATDLFYHKRISTSELIDVEQFLFSKGYRFSDTLNIERPPFSPVYEILFQQRNGQLTTQQATDQINALRNLDVRNDFNRYFYQKALNQQHAINVKGGSATIAWLLSAGVDRNLNELDAGYNRFNFRSDNRIQLASKLNLTTGIYFTQSKASAGKPGYGDIRQIRGGLPPYSQFADPQGNPLPFYKDYRKTYIDTAGAGNLLDWKYFPLEDYKHIHNRTTLQDVVGNLGINYELVKGFSADVKYQYQKQEVTGRNLSDKQSYFARNLTNIFYQPGAVNKFPVPKGAILDLSTSSIVAQNIRGQLNFEKSWKKNHVAVIAGGEIRELRTKSNSYRIYGYNDATLTSAKVDYSNPYTTFVTGGQTFIPSNQSLTDRLNRFISVYANAAYTYSQKYTFSLSGRRDASNTFGVNTNDKWTPLWSAGASWDIGKELFYQSSTLPSLKLRFTYGFSGNVDPSLTAVTTIRYSSTSPFTLSPFAEVDNYYNPDLRWEKSRQINLGLDFKFCDNRISGSIEYYQKKGMDLYGPALIDYTAGLGIPSITKNVAGMKATGCDLELNTINLKGRFTWTTQLNLSFYKDKVTSYYLRSLQGSNFVGDGIGISGFIGKPVSSVFSYRWAGLNPITGDPQGYDANKQVSKDYSALTGSDITINDLVYHGPGMPKVYGSMGNSFSWKNLSLIIRFTYKFGHYFRRQSINYNSLFLSLNGHADYSKRWQNPGDEAFTNIPSMVYPLVNTRESFYNSSEVLVEKADFLRLQYINFSYTLIKQQLKKSPIQAMQLYINMNDLGILWRANKYGLDPDYTISAIPPSKNIALGIRLNF